MIEKAFGLVCVCFLLLVVLVLAGPTLQQATSGIASAIDTINSNPPAQLSFLESAMQADGVASQPELLLDTYIDTDSHANIHAEADLVRAACANPSMDMWVRSSKKVDICFVPDLGWGFRVWKQIGGVKDKLWSERTAYHRIEIQCEKDLEEYARLNGWTLRQLVDGVWKIIVPGSYIP